jgi:sn-glycerol 3-phosphate transport system permease protein
MIEKTGTRTVRRHCVLLVGILVCLFPVYAALVASSHTAIEILGQFPVWFGTHIVANYKHVLVEGIGGAAPPVGRMLLNSFIMALGISVGKIVISIFSAYAVVYFRFPLRKFCFWLIFITLMLPVQVRILPTYHVVATLHMLDTYSGLIVPLIASATATFFFRQFFLTIPDELMEAARIDGAGPMRFFFDIILPLSRTTIAALFVIEFIYGWNLYLWPLIVTTHQSMYTIVMGIQHLANVPQNIPPWNLVMATAILAILPPLVIVIAMQRQFVKGFIEPEK